MYDIQVIKKVVAAIKFKFDLKQAEMAKEMGVNKTYFSSVINGNEIISELFLDKLCTAFGVNKDYIAKGEGEIFSSPSIIQKNEKGDNINGHSVKVEQQNNVEKLIDTIKECHELLRKKDEQIDRLLTLLENK